MQAARQKNSTVILAVFALLLLFNTVFWFNARKTLPEWNNVGPAPSTFFAGFLGLGDTEISYRLYGYFLQNVGNVGGRFESLKKYNYADLEKWFFLTQDLDARADYVPYLAAYMFGSVEDQDKSKVAHVVTYLADHGQLSYPQKWRWLAQAVYLARYREENLPRALDLAYKMAALPTDTAPWARQMPAFVLMKMGNKEAAYDIMIQMLASEKDKLDPNEINEMHRYICTRTLEPREAAKNPLCQDIR